MVKKVISGGKPPKELKEPGISWNMPENNSIENVGKEKLESLQKAVDEINELIKQREILSKKIFDDAENIKIDISNFFAETPTGEQEIREKIALKQKQVEISELQLNEKISSWKDIALLKKELRERERELSDKKSRVEMLDKILEEK